MMAVSEDDLHAFVDGQLEPSRRAEVEAYLAAHPAMAERFAAYGRDARALRDAFAPIAREPLPARLGLRPGPAARRRPALWMGLAAAILLLLGGTGGWWLRDWAPPASGGIALLAQEAAANYRLFATDRQRPVEVRAPADLALWSSERIGRAPVLPDLSAAGYRMMGGRVVSTDHGAALMLMYDDDKGSRLVVFSRPMQIERDAPMARLDTAPLAGWSWSSNGMGYSLVGSLPPDILHPLADEIRRQIAKS